MSIEQKLYAGQTCLSLQLHQFLSHHLLEHGFHPRLSDHCLLDALDVVLDDVDGGI